ncbi:MAG: hypothetical protein ACLUUO_12510 [Sellimonas intestinalis]
MQKQGYSKVPVFENGLAQPVFPFTDGKTGEDYDPSYIGDRKVLCVCGIRL